MISPIVSRDALAALWAAGFLLLLPFSNIAEYHLSLTGFLGLWLLLRWRTTLAALPGPRWMLAFYLCLLIPMLLSAPDSFDAEKSWTQSIASLRALFGALAMAWLVRTAERRDLLLRITAWVLVLWSVDGIFQFLVGYNLLGFPDNAERLNGIFGDGSLRFGVILAILAPLGLEHARRHWPRWGFFVLFGMIATTVLLTGVRAGWIMLGLLALAYALILLKVADRRFRPVAVVLPLAVVVIFIAAYFVSPLVKERTDLTLGAATGTSQALAEASNRRAPIWSASMAMIRDHPINGVGVSAFPEAYREYALADDIHMRHGGPAAHAHNLVLEVLTDTGLIGLLGLLCAALLSMRLWWQADRGRQRQMLPFALALALIYFPLNSYFSFFGSNMTLLTWWLMGLFLSPWFAPPPNSAAEKTP